MNSDQLKFWKGEFGDQYIARNSASEEELNKIASMWSKAFSQVPITEIKSILEIGSNIGNNLRALKKISNAELYAVEPNSKAFEILVRENVVLPDHAYNVSGFDIPQIESSSKDLVFTNGVLIHIFPQDLPKVTDEIVRISKKYIVCSEYFSDKEEEVTYRGHSNVLFKRDFGSYYLDRYPNLRILDYGFQWKRVTGLDNLTWFLFEKI